MIYRYCVVANGAIDPYQNIEQHKIVVLCPQKPDLALLKVNKQVGKEAKTVLFGGNTWRLFYESDSIAACKPWKKGELATKFWNTNIKSFRHLVTGFDFLDQAGSPIPSAPTGHAIIDTSLAGLEEEEGNYNKILMRQLVYSWEWKKNLLEQTKLRTFLFNLDHGSCRDRCRRLEIVHFACNELSILRQHWKTTRVVVNGTRDRAERRLVHEVYGFPSR